MHVWIFKEVTNSLIHSFLADLLKKDEGAWKTTLSQLEAQLAEMSDGDGLEIGYFLFSFSLIPHCFSQIK